MKNRTYYGEYTLEHWIQLILIKNLKRPEYQRLFVWTEEQVKCLIKSLKDGHFVQPVTIGAFRDNVNTVNYVIDGQQRLTSILLAYLGLYPDVDTFKETMNMLQQGDEHDDNDPDVEEPVQLDNILKFTFEDLVNHGTTKEEILRAIPSGNYKVVNYDVNQDFFKKTFLGFTYLVPEEQATEQEQQHYYSTAFRHMNIMGTNLLPMESRRSLYFLNRNLSGFFSPEFAEEIVIETAFHKQSQFDFVRYLSLLSQYIKNGNSVASIAYSYKTRMEKYFEEYVYAVANDVNSDLFGKFSTIIAFDQIATRIENLKNAIGTFSIPKQTSSIIDQDIWYFGLIYKIVFQDNTLDTTKAHELASKVTTKITECKGDGKHVKAPGALKYLRERMNKSIAIYGEIESHA